MDVVFYLFEICTYIHGHMDMLMEDKTIIFMGKSHVEYMAFNSNYLSWYSIWLLHTEMVQDLIDI